MSGLATFCVGFILGAAVGVYITWTLFKRATASASKGTP